ncbi:MAG: hypothetical protein JJU19_10010 [Pararhodobacter sp.]|nr:hypothetical protein [Pararhodobacter sp.]
MATAIQLQISDLRSRIDKLRHTVNSTSGGVFIVVGIVGSMAALFGFTKTQFEAGFGLAISLIIVFYGFYSNDKARKASEELVILERQLSLLEQEYEKEEQARIQRSIELDLDDDDYY